MSNSDEQSLIDSILKPDVELPAGDTCNACKARKDLQRCGGCQVVLYCSKGCQIGNWGSHKAICVPVKKARAQMDREEKRLRSHPGNIDLPRNPFETAVGSFWGYTETRPYMAARWKLIGPLQDVETKVALTAVLEHLLDMHRLCRADNLGVRQLTPFVMLRLGKDQEAYDFVNWWATTANDNKYDSMDHSTPYLDVRNANAYEEPTTFLRDQLGISHIVAVILIKLRLQHDALFGDLDPGNPAHPTNTAVRRSFVDDQDCFTLMQMLKRQIKSLYNVVHARNPHFWQGLQNPDANLNSVGSMSPYMRLGSIEEMQITLKYCYEAWHESTGALETIHKIGKQAI